MKLHYSLLFIFLTLFSCTNKSTEEASLPDSLSEIEELIGNKKWEVTDLKIKNLEPFLTESGATPETIKESNINEVKNMSFSTLPNNEFKYNGKNVDCSNLKYKIDKKEDKVVLLVVCETPQGVNFASDYQILGINDSFLYLMKKKGEFPFEIEYTLKATNN